jgi:hypothetical protein
MRALRSDKDQRQHGGIVNQVDHCIGRQSVEHPSKCFQPLRIR